MGALSKVLLGLVSMRSAPGQGYYGFIFANDDRQALGTCSTGAQRSRAWPHLITQGDEGHETPLQMAREVDTSLPDKEVVDCVGVTRTAQPASACLSTVRALGEACSLDQGL